MSYELLFSCFNFSQIDAILRTYLFYERNYYVLISLTVVSIENNMLYTVEVYRLPVSKYSTKFLEKHPW